MLESFLAAVADNAVGATVLAVAVFVVTRLWRNPAAQHVLWLLVLVKLITPCVIPLPFGGITVGSVSLTEIPKRPVASSISSGIEGPIAATKPADRGHQMGVHAPSADAALMDSGEHSLSFFLLLVWMALSGAWLVVAGRRIVQFHRGLKSTAIASTAVQDLARAVANRLGYVSPLEVRIAESQLPPLLWCVGRPKIVLAQGLYSTLGTDELRGILAHEISHLLRRDHWARWLELVVFGAYWWHPVAWWARRELREAEERACDARVLAAWPGTESQYAGALLAVVDLARRPTLRVPAVANSFGNNGSLKRRIETMFERNVPERMTCRAAAIMLLTGMVLLPVSLRSRGAEQSGKTATLAEIREGFTKFEKRILNLSVNSESDVDNHFRNATGGPVPKGLIQEDTYDLLQKCVSTWIVDASGRIWQKHSAQVTAIRADKSEVKHQLEIEAAFDGKGGRWIQTEHRAEGDRVHVREINRPECYGTLSPLDFSLHYVGTPIRQILAQGDARVAGSETWEGRPVLVVEAGLPTQLPGKVEYQQRLWIDASRGFAAVRKQSMVRDSKDGPWHLHYDCASYDFREIAPGVWLPSRVEDKNFAVGPSLERAPLNLVTHDVIRFRDWKVNSNIPDSKFQISVSIDSDLHPDVILKADPRPAE